MDISDSIGGEPIGFDKALNVLYDKYRTKAANPASATGKFISIFNAVLQKYNAYSEKKLEKMVRVLDKHLEAHPPVIDPITQKMVLPADHDGLVESIYDKTVFIVSMLLENSVSTRTHKIRDLYRLMQLTDGSGSIAKSDNVYEQLLDTMKKTVGLPDDHEILKAYLCDKVHACAIDAQFSARNFLIGFLSRVQEHRMIAAYAEKIDRPVPKSYAENIETRIDVFLDHLDPYFRQNAPDSFNSSYLDRLHVGISDIMKRTELTRGRNFMEQSVNYGRITDAARIQAAGTILNALITGTAGVYISMYHKDMSDAALISCYFAEWLTFVGAGFPIIQQICDKK